MKLILVAILVVLEVSLSERLNLPEELRPRCRKNDPKLNLCLLNGVERIRPLLLEGIPEIEFPPLEPFYMEELPLLLKSIGLKFDGEAKDIMVLGLGNFEIKEFTMNYKTERAHLKIRIPEVHVTATYQTDGSRFGFFKARSDGSFTGKFVDVNVDLEARGKLDDDSAFGGPVYLRVPFVGIQLSFGRGSTYKMTPKHSNFIGKLATGALNLAPKRLILFMLKKSIATTVAQIVKKYANDILDKIPFEDLFASDKPHHHNPKQTTEAPYVYPNGYDQKPDSPNPYDPQQPNSPPTYDADEPGDEDYVDEHLIK